MDDLEIDRALRATVSESPSPDFVARVRTALAEAPRPTLFAGMWKPVVALACVALMLIAVWVPREETPAQAGLKPSTTYVPSTTIAEMPAAPVVVVPTFRSAKSTNRSTRRRVAIAPEPPMPEVIIATEDVEAVRQFVSGARDRRFVVTFEEAPSLAAWAMNDLVIAPITVEPLDSTQSHNN